jgi:hypothetical protein
LTLDSFAEADPDRNARPILILRSVADNPISGLIIEGNNVNDGLTGYSEDIAVNGNVDGFEIVKIKVLNISNIGSM